MIVPSPIPYFEQPYVLQAFERPRGGFREATDRRGLLIGAALTEFFAAVRDFEAYRRGRGRGYNDGYGDGFGAGQDSL